MRFLFNYFKIMRPLNLMLCCISVLIASYLIKSASSPYLLYTIITVLCFAGASNILNDILDINIDKINRPTRILVSGKIRLIEAILLMLSLYGTGILTTYFIYPLGQKIALFFVLPLSILYTPLFKCIPFIGNVVVGSIIGLVFIFTESALLGTVNRMWLPFFLASGLSTIRELCKDGEDILGDAISKVNTFPIVFGLFPTVWLLRLLSILLSFIAILPFINSQYGIFYFIAVLLGIIIPLLYCVFILLDEKPSNLDFSKVSRMLKFLTIIGMGVILSTGF